MDKNIFVACLVNEFAKFLSECDDVIEGIEKFSSVTNPHRCGPELKSRDYRNVVKSVKGKL